MLEADSSALMMVMFINKLIFTKAATLSKENPRVILLSPSTSDIFSCGMDVNGEPYLGIHEDLLPYFTDVNWTDAAVDYENGYLYLCNKSMDANELLFSIGISFRLKRLNVFWPMSEKEIPHAVMNMKKLSTTTYNGELKTLISDEHIYTGIKMLRVNSVDELHQSQYDENYAGMLLRESGIDESFTSF
jgi:hypothetical protein